MAHPTASCSISAYIRKPLLMIPIRCTKGNFLNSLIYKKALGKKCNAKCYNSFLILGHGYQIMESQNVIANLTAIMNILINFIIKYTLQIILITNLKFI